MVMTQLSTPSGIAKHVDISLFTGFISFNFCLSNLVGSNSYYGWFMENLNNIILFAGSSELIATHCIGDWPSLYYCELRVVWPQYLLTHVWPCYHGKHTLHAEKGHKSNSLVLLFYKTKVQLSNVNKKVNKLFCVCICTEMPFC